MGVISGSIVEAGSGIFITKDADVEAVNPVTEEHLGWAEVGPDGTYHLSLPLGEYKVKAYLWDYDIEQYYDQTDSFEEAQVVILEESNREQYGIDFSISFGGTIRGTITANDLEDNIIPVEQVELIAINTDTWEWQGGVKPDENGFYEIRGLDDGRYKLIANPSLEINLAIQYYGGTKYFEDGFEIIIENEAQVSGINLHLPAGGQILGQVTDQVTSLPLDKMIGIDIFDYDNGKYIASFPTDETSNFGFNLPYGKYRIGTSNWDNSRYIMEFFIDKYDFESADSVELTEQSPQIQIQFALELGGEISGIVLDQDGNPVTVEGMEITVLDPSDGNWVAANQTKPDGSYFVSGLRTGDYKLQIRPFGTDYAMQYYDGQTDFDSALIVHVDQGVETTDINFSLEAGGKISGSLIDGTTNNPLTHNIGINLLDSVSGQYLLGTDVGAEGTYQLENIPFGSYKLEIQSWDNTYINEYYQDQYLWENADSVSLDEFNTELELDIILDSPENSPLTVVEHHLDTDAIIPAQPNTHLYLEMNRNCAFTFELRIGETLLFSETRDDQYYIYESDWNGCDPEGNPVPQGVYNYTIIMTDQYGISNQVTGSVTVDLTPPEVAINNPAEGYFTNQSSITIEGEINEPCSEVRINGIDTVPEGNNFSLEVSLIEGNNTITAQATDLVGNQGSSQPVNIMVDPSVSIIAGAVAKLADGNPVAETVVIALEAETRAMLGSAMTDDQGEYRLILQPGNYKLYFFPAQGSNLGVRWYNSRFFDEAVVLSLAAGQEIVLEQVSLEPGGIIQGAVYQQSSGSPVTSGISIVALEAATMRTVGVFSLGTVTTDGTYALNLPYGTYKIMALSQDGLYLNEFYDNTYLVETALPVTIDEQSLPQTIIFAIDTPQNSPIQVSNHTIDNNAINPTNATAQISLEVDRYSIFNFQIKDTDNNVIKNETTEAPTYLFSPSWNGLDDQGAPFTQGNYTYTITSFAEYGLTTQVSGSIFLDLTPPTVMILSPVNGFLTNQSPVTVEGSTSEACSVVGVNGINTVPEDNTFSLELALVEGQNTITAQATDLGVNQGVSQPVNVILDTIAPVIVITSPDDGALVGQAAITSQYTVDGVAKTKDFTLSEGDNTLTIEESDAAGNSSSESIMVSLDSIPPEIVITSPEEGVSLNTSPVLVEYTVDSVAKTKSFDLLEGVNALTIEEVDTVGNMGSATVNVALDTIAPVIVITSPADGALVNQADITVEYTVDSVAKTKSFDLVEGANALVVEETDAAGNTGSATVNITLDTTPPLNAAIEILGSEYTNQTGVQLLLSADGADEMMVSRLNDFSDTAWVGYQSEQGFSLSTGDGQKYIYAKFKDQAGNETEMVYDTVTLDQTPPLITITSPENNSLIRTEQVNISGSLNEICQQVTVNEMAAENNGGGFTLNNFSLQPGNNTVAAYATDLAGNIGYAEDISLIYAIGVVKGVITDEVTGQPLSNILVVMFNDFDWFDAVTGENGEYQFINISSGDYKIGVWESDKFHMPQFLNGKRHWWQADMVYYNANSDAEYNFALQQAGAISGRVTDSQGNPLAGVEVRGYKITTDGSQADFPFTTTGENGNYLLKSLYLADYIIQVSPKGQEYAKEFYNNKYYSEEADYIAVALMQETVSIDFSLSSEAGKISGSIIDQTTGTPITYGLDVYLKNAATGRWIADMGADTNGNYYFENIPYGEYKIEAFCWEGGYLSEHYNNKYIFEQGDTIVINSNTEQTINFGLDLPQNSTLRIVEHYFEPTAYINPNNTFSITFRAEAERWSFFSFNIKNGMQNVIYENSTDFYYFGYETYWNGRNSEGNIYPDGEYQYYLTATDSFGINAYASGKVYIDTVIPQNPGVSIEEGEQTESRNIHLNLSVEDISPVEMKISEGDLWDESLEWIPFSSSYPYELTEGVGEKTVFVIFRDKAGNMTDIVSDTITLGEPQDVISITGEVNGSTGSGSEPVSGALMIAYKLDDPDWEQTCLTNAEGIYQFLNFPSGSYRIEINHKFYNVITSHTIDYDATGGTEVADFSLAQRGAISGMIKDGGSLAGVGAVFISALNVDTDQWFGAVVSDEQGHYLFGSLPEGNYKIIAMPYGLDYARQWYTNKVHQADADIVSVVNLQETSADFELQPGAKIRGTVVDQTSGVKLYQGIGVSIWDSLSETYLFDYNVDINDQGEYLLENIPYGEYKLAAVAWDSNYLTEYYDNKYLFDNAEIITIDSIQEQVIDFTLDVPGNSPLTILSHGVEPSAYLSPTGFGVTIKGETERNAYFELIIKDSLGNIVGTMANQIDPEYDGPMYQFRAYWNGYDDQGSPCLEGEYTYYLRAYDDYVSSPEVSGTVYIDTTPPQNVSITIDEGVETTTPEVHLTLQADGASEMAISENIEEIYNSTISWMPYSTSYTYNFDLAEGLGERTIYAIYRDQAGNDTEAQLVSASILLNIDLTQLIETATVSPTLFNPDTGGDYPQVNIEASLIRECDWTVLVRADNLGIVQSESGTGTQISTTWAGQGSDPNVEYYTVEISVVDMVNNQVDSYLQAVKLDRTPPGLKSAPFITEGPFLNDINISVNLNAYGDPAFVALSLDGITYGSWLSFSEVVLYQLPNIDGTYEIYAKLKDKVGNESEASLLLLLHISSSHLDSILHISPKLSQKLFFYFLH
ncbi:hypothetical protein ACFLQ1_01820 [Candidatus Auribacterota bacterium]